MGFVLRADPAELEPDSDVRAVILDGVASVTPLSIDMTAKVDAETLARWGKSLGG